MPFTMEWPDTVYKPQFDVTVKVTVTQPFRKEQCVFIACSVATEPTGVSKGYCYFNTEHHELRVYNGTQYNSYTMHTREEGYIYWVNSSSTFYRWTGSILSPISLTNEWNHVYINTTSFGAQPASAIMGDWYFNTSNHTLYYYNNFAWVAFGSSLAGSSYLFAHDNRLWYYYPADTSMHPYYGWIKFFKSGGTVGPIIEVMSSSVTFNYTFTYPGEDRAVSYDMRTTWYNDDGNRAQYLPEISQKYEEQTTAQIQGRGGTVNSNISWISPLNTYPTTDDEFSAHLLCSPTATDTASILVPIDKTELQASEYYGVTWYLSKSGGEGGSFSGLKLSEGAKMGYVTMTKTQASAGYNYSKQSLRVKYSGDYTLKGEYKYRNSLGVLCNGSKSLSWKVYATASPVIEISTSPAPSPDPEIFPPPYTVVLHDASSVSNPYQIPMRTITMDADDSSNAESWTLENEAPYPLITIPDKTHVYNGYGPYRPSITITDMNGNTAVAYAQFAPNKTPRVYIPTGELDSAKITYDGTDYRPSSTITGDDAPILLTGNAFVAGSPLPDVKWSYALNPSSEYYQGEKDGAFSELSLLSGGTYDVTCKVTNGNLTLGEFAWTATATTTTIPDTPVSLQDFAIWVYDVDGGRIDRITPTSAQYVDRFAHSSYCEFEVPIDYPHIDRLWLGCMLAFGYLGKARVMIVTGFEEDQDGLTVRITAIDAASHALSSRVATTATRSTGGNGYDAQTCSAEALLRYFAVSNIQDSARQIPQLKIVGTCQDAGGRTTYSARYEDILTIFEDICTDSGLGWDSALQSATTNTFSLSVIAGTDRTYNTMTGGIIFEDRKNGRGSATIGNYAGFLGSNIAIAAGKGNGSSRPYYEYTKNIYRTIVPADQTTYPLKVSDGSHGTVAGNTYLACKETDDEIFGYYCPDTHHWVPVVGMSGYDIKVVDYLQFSGTQKIDTGFTPDNDTSLKMVYKTDRLNSVAVYGAYGNTWTTNNYGMYYNAATHAWSNYNCDTQFTPTPALDVEHTVYQNKNLLYVDNALKLTHAESTFTSDVTLKLGRLDGVIAANNFTFSGYIKSVEIWDDGTLVRDMVPVFYNSVYGLLDKANWVIYTNVGTGSLSGGQITGYIQYADTVTGLNRREVFVDAGESADGLEMQREAEVELNKQDEKSIVVYPNQGVYRLGVDYNVGDYVTVRTKSGIMLDVQIIQANSSLDSTGKQLSLECGTDLRSYQRLIRETKLANTYARK